MWLFGVDFAYLRKAWSIRWPAWREAETTQTCDTHGTGHEPLNPTGRLTGIVIFLGKCSTAFPKFPLEIKLKTEFVMFWSGFPYFFSKISTYISPRREIMTFGGRFSNFYPNFPLKLHQGEELWFLKWRSIFHHLREVSPQKKVFGMCLQHPASLCVPQVMWAGIQEPQHPLKSPYPPFFGKSLF